MVNETLEEYSFLEERLDETIWALRGSCNDIDCNKYIYKDLLKKRYKPVLDHNFSCMPNLKKEKEALMRILSNKKYAKCRHKKCYVCRNKLDSLDEKSKIISFTRPSKINENYIEIKIAWVHKKCSKKVKAPEGWSFR
ncbi:MAG: hypothetical protein AABX03_03550 [Nanoarchaeota archaeon]